MSLTDLQPRVEFVCEHPDDDRGAQLTLRTESSERYCVEHFPYHDEAERAATLDQLLLLGHCRDTVLHEFAAARNLEDDHCGYCGAPADAPCHVGAQS